ncbi:NUDIX domain-containing protein [Microbacterium paludicola]|uniref:NUDIX domain-containing protein n=1 Tax=Microbacterium paludicola TaxID=300019 RepID=A0A4Y9FQV3_9MICO|nr:NUDIX domain-containing protein [Microbacterium paludicola]MBF0817343.1 NUDIX domain-containing protein [Microbacterium paludicola]TFU31581.1 NUDIX domain-containing protein [Microbacterium paludicola]
MTIEPARPGEPPRFDGPRDPGDAWVVADTGERYWGRFGAAGLMAFDAERGVLLQHRVGWSHHGGTWALPGGALHQGEPAIDGALREASEEAGVPSAAVRPRFTHVLDLGVWSYTTVVADVVEHFAGAVTDPESLAVEWTSIDQVDQHPLHPGFAAAWTSLRDLVHVHPVVVVDAANVVGSVPDGWWKDRAGATERLLTRVAGLAPAGVPAEALGLGATHWFPEFVVVVEGKARDVMDVDGVRTVRAAGEGDDTIATETAALVEDGRTVTVVTSDRGLRARAEEAGAIVHGARWLLELLG